MGFIYASLCYFLIIITFQRCSHDSFYYGLSSHWIIVKTLLLSIFANLVIGLFCFSGIFLEVIHF
jgi:hypothetical protein